MIKLNEDKQMVMELPWETVELIVRNALKEDLDILNGRVDSKLTDALERVYQYYGGNLHEIPSN